MIVFIKFQWIEIIHINTIHVYNIYDIVKNINLAFTYSKRQYQTFEHQIVRSILSQLQVNILIEIYIGLYFVQFTQHKKLIYSYAMAFRNEPWSTSSLLFCIHSNIMI